MTKTYYDKEGMIMILFQNGNRFTESKYANENDFEQEIVQSHKLFFGEGTIFIDAKKKIRSASLGNTIPDGFLFDMSDPENREFYLVEVELASHSFYEHIFPQITKFFAFFKNPKRQKELTEKLFSTINTDLDLKKQFKKYLGEKEIFKFLNDVIDSSQNILMVIDGDKPELPEIIDTYTDTWGKMVKIITVKKFSDGVGTMFSIDPEFNDLEDYTGAPPIIEQPKVSEEFHLEDVNDNVKKIYYAIKDQMLKIKPTLVFNPATYYISIRDKKAFAYLKMRKKKMVMTTMFPEDKINASLAHHNIRSLSASVQNYYGGPCASVDIVDLDNFEEIIELLNNAMKYNLPPEK